MKHLTDALLPILLAATGLQGAVTSGPEPGRLTLRHDRPGTVWRAATPLGNGWLGAMMFGDPAQEVFHRNEPRNATERLPLYEVNRRRENDHSAPSVR